MIHADCSRPTTQLNWFGHRRGKHQVDKKKVFQGSRPTHVGHTQSVPETCLYCNKPAGKNSMRKASTFDLYKHVSKSALKLQDLPLLVKLSAGDLIAQDAQYNLKCLVSLYNKARAITTTVEDQDYINHGRTLRELVSYIDDVRMEALVSPVFKLADLTSLHTTRLEHLGTAVTGRVHSTKIKDRIMIYFSDMEEHKRGGDILFAFNLDVGSYQPCTRHVSMMLTVMVCPKRHVEDEDGLWWVFSHPLPRKNGANSLIALVSLILNGPNIQEQANQSSVSASTLTISQLSSRPSRTTRLSDMIHADCSRPTTQLNWFGHRRGKHQVDKNKVFQESRPTHVGHTQSVPETCFYCNKPAGKDSMRKASTFINM